MSNKQLIPALRFKGFTAPWEQCELGNIMNVTSVKRVHQSDWTTKGVRFLRARDIVSAYKNEDSNDSLYISKEIYEEYSALSGKVLVNDLLVTGVGTIGIPYLIKGDEPLYFKDGNVIWFQNNNKIWGDFFYYSFTGNKIQNFIKESAGIGTVGTYTIDSGKKTPIILPSIREQNKIGNLFNSLNNLITLHQRKLEKLKNLKKAMLEKMFPKNGSTIPDIRFSGFTDAWEQCELGEIVQITMGQSPDGNTYSDLPGNYILVQGNADLKNGWVKPRIWTTQITKKAFAGDLIMSVRAPAGDIGKTAYDVVIGRGVSAIKGNEFIYQTLVKMNQVGYWKKLSSGSTFESLTSSNIKNAEIIAPLLLEQNKIGVFFKLLDSAITLHQRKLEKLKNINKSLLEKMFV